MDKLQKILVPVGAIVVFTLLWELLVWANGWPDYVMASPSDLPQAYERFWNLFLIGSWQTLWRTVAGLMLAVIFGTGLGMIMGFSRIARDALAMSMVFSPTPSQNRLSPAEEPPDSTTGVGKSVFSPKASATMDA